MSMVAWRAPEGAPEAGSQGPTAAASRFDATRTMVSRSIPPSGSAAPAADLGDSLPRYATGAPVQEAAGIAIEGPLGRGGMAAVYLASQPALGRKVAVKALKTGEDRQEVSDALLREGRITGSLEHPNVVPVHTLGADEQGHPLLVMRHIEGELWHDLLLDQPVRGLDDEGFDRLQRHLEILVQVCNAVHFAHSRGVIHRDIKPGNVMVGRFGEVYVLDWGIAVTRGQVSEAEGAQLVGSPAYMAPEMLSGRPQDVGPRTDVYLLGATLYRILAGEPLRRGETLEEVLEQVRLGEIPPLPSWVPDALGDVCRRALARSPLDRYESVEALRRAVVDILRHRSSITLALTAQRRLEDVRGALQERSGAPSSGHEAYRALHECRFGFAQALALWPGNRLAQIGHRESVSLSIEQELERGQIPVAVQLLKELDPRAPELEARVRQAWRRHQVETARLDSLRKLARELDLDISGRERGLLVLGIAVVSLPPALLMGFLSRHGHLEISPSVSLGAAWVLSMATLGLIWMYRRPMTRTRINRQLTGGVIVGLGALFVNRLRASLVGEAMTTTVSGELLLYATLVASLGIIVDRRILWSAPIYVAGAFLSARLDGWAYEISGVANFLALGIIALGWLSPGADGAGEPLASAPRVERGGPGA